MALRPQASAHLREVLGWTPAAPLDARTLAIAALGMVVPVSVGLALGRPHVGFTIGLGAMLLADQTPAATAAAAQDRPSAFAALAPAALAVTLATLIAGGPWTDPAMILLAAAAATVSGYSRPAAVTAIRFIVYLVLSVSLLESAGGHRTAVALIFGLGAVWNMAIRTLLRGPAASPAPPARKPTPAQLRAHFRKTMRELAGWQFSIRVVAGLAAASLLRHIWPSHHFFWIVLTVALLTQRPLEPVPVKITQRAAGAFLGVGLTWAILAGVASPLALAAIICVLGVAAPLARSRSYLVYSVISTPVILLVMDLGKPVATALLTDRLAATLMGAGIVVALNLLLERVTRRPNPPPPNAVRA